MCDPRLTTVDEEHCELYNGLLIFTVCFPIIFSYFHPCRYLFRYLVTNTLSLYDRAGIPALVLGWDFPAFPAGVWYSSSFNNLVFFFFVMTQPLFSSIKRCFPSLICFSWLIVNLIIENLLITNHYGQRLNPSSFWTI